MSHLALAHDAPTPLPQSTLSQTGPARITVRTDFIHELAGETAKSWGEPHSFVTKFSEQPYERKLVIGDRWQLLDLGWAKDSCCFLWIRHVPRQWMVNPTPEERAEAESQRVEIADGNLHSTAFAFISPGRDHGPVEPAQTYSIRTNHGQVKIHVVAIPR